MAVSPLLDVESRPMRPLQGSTKAAVAGAFAFQASERPKASALAESGLGSLPGPAAALEPGKERPQAGSHEKHGESVYGGQTKESV
jgi:hypothetical protein